MHFTRCCVSTVCTIKSSGTQIFLQNLSHKDFVVRTYTAITVYGEFFWRDLYFAEGKSERIFAAYFLLIIEYRIAGYFRGANILRFTIISHFVGKIFTNSFLALNIKIAWRLIVCIHSRVPSELQTFCIKWTYC